jgi:hypothetical protein
MDHRLASEMNSPLSMMQQQRRNELGEPMCMICGKAIKATEPAVRPDRDWVHLRCARAQETAPPMKRGR